jgi:hypothetical protein
MWLLMLMHFLQVNLGTEEKHGFCRESGLLAVVAWAYPEIFVELEFYGSIKLVLSQDIILVEIARSFGV